MNAALFLPVYLTAAGPADVLPFTPREHPHGAYGFDAVSAVEYVKALLLRRANPDVFRVSLEFVLLLLWVGWRRDSKRVRDAAAGLYVSTLLLLSYHHAYRLLYRVEPALWEDVRLLPSLLGFVASVTHQAVPMALLGLLVLTAFLLFRAASWALGAWQTRASPRGLLGLGALGASCVVSLLWFGVRRDDPVLQLPAKALAANLRASLKRRDELAVLRDGGVDDRYRLALRARLDRKPRVYLLMLEAYGQRLVTDPELSQPYARLTERVTSELAARGFEARSAFSRAPVYGGRSWLSVATVQTGVFIDAASIHDEMAAHATKLATLTEFFRANGYSTYALVPGNYVKGMADPYRRDVVLDYLNLGYMGQHYGYVGVPDQYSLRTYRSRVLDQATRPFFAFYLSISTHHPFPEIPFEGGGEWGPIAGTEAIVSPMHRPYFRSVEYQWRTLLEFMTAEASDDAVFFLVGDHQPLLERTMDDVRELTELQSSNTPVHVISRNKAFVARFEKYGFAPGLFAAPGAGALKHEGLQSLLIHELVGEYGGVGEQRFTKYYPDGIGLGGLVAP